MIHPVSEQLLPDGALMAPDALVILLAGGL